MSNPKLVQKGSGGVGQSISRAASKFFLGSSQSERNASYWRAVDEPDQSQTTHEVTAMPPTNPTDGTTNPWWLQDDLWAVDDEEDDTVELPSYPPPSYSQANLGKHALNQDGKYIGPQATKNGDDFSAADLLTPTGPGLRRCLSTADLNNDDSNAISYKGRGRGRRRRVGGLKRSNSLGSMMMTQDDGRGPIGAAFQAQVANKAGSYLKPPHLHRRSVPYFTVIITLIDIIMMIWEFVVGGGFAPPRLNPMLGPPVATLITTGGKWVPSILNLGEWWRFFSAMFLHAGLVHITINLLGQTKICWDLEKVHGSWRLIPIYLLSGVGGNVLSALFLPKQVTVGASGAIFGFYGLLLVDLFKNWKHVTQPKGKLLILIISIVVSFAMGLLPGVDNFAHFGGFVVGTLSGIVFLPSMTFGKWNIKMKLIQVCVAIPLLVGYFVGILVPFYKTTDGEEFCKWCRYIACLPFWKSCSGQS